MHHAVYLTQIIENLQLEFLATGTDFDQRMVQNVVASDLMSDVLVVAQDDVLLITSLASDQMIRTADLVGAAAVVLVNGKQAPVSLIALAKELNITLLRTPQPKYETCLAVGKTIEPGEQQS